MAEEPQSKNGRKSDSLAWKIKWGAIFAVVIGIASASTGAFMARGSVSAEMTARIGQLEQILTNRIDRKVNTSELRFVCDSIKKMEDSFIDYSSAMSLQFNDMSDRFTKLSTEVTRLKTIHERSYDNRP